MKNCHDCFIYAQIHLNLSISRTFNKWWLGKLYHTLSEGEKIEMDQLFVDGGNPFKPVEVAA